VGTARATNEELLAKNRSLEEENDQLRKLLRQKDQYIETQIERRSHVFDVILSNLPDLICTFDLQGCFTYANQALLGVWQKSLAEIIGKNTFDLGYPPNWPPAFNMRSGWSSRPAERLSITRPLPVQTERRGFTSTFSRPSSLPIVPSKR
jgi:PAS domain-containing protein